MPKPDFRQKKDERSPWKTQEIVTPESLPDHTIISEQASKAPVADVAQSDTRTHARTHVRTDASKQAQKKRSTTIETLYRQIQSKKHLSSYTFRYRPEELDELEKVFTQIEGEHPGKVSRNDLARLALNALFEDYRDNKETSVLAQVIERM